MTAESSPTGQSEEMVDSGVSAETSTRYSSEFRASISFLEVAF